MKSFIALIKREYLEHRGAFLYGPLILIGLMVVGTVLPFLAGRIRADYFGEEIGGTLKFYELAFMASIAGWTFYLLITLFFYYADAFSADKRNNAMLFWKSMPVSDLKVLSSKMVAGLTVFPALIFLAMLFSGAWAYVMALMVHWQFPLFAAPDFIAAVNSFWRIGLVGMIFLALVLLWIAPFFAWAGALSTAVGRWALPMAALIPGILILLENVFLKGQDGGFILNYLRYRADFTWARNAVQNQIISLAPVDIVRFVSDLLAHIDWVQMVAGWAFVVIVIVAASEYRRRKLD
ncbi:hypothetical protein [Paradevosia shaoguanensis]|jgi:ABC-2 type transport system permease protein|uniref:ABC transporter permease n=1 Tax=Paradevosia shaoguanensis TaxID=1335043 RepID=A0AA41QQH2_9HYPH|nr:hypothetical protein [Paradevosia shaoguanensis]MCF1743308.1 hypothetical protein [Paradevosia shaoguanensis]MCI0127791.1 hypothetical protein [Paradevosia shaoguanensis]